MKKIHSKAVSAQLMLTVHIVQRLAPGGLEVLVVELAKNLPGNHLILSLEGTTSALKAAWPRLQHLDIHGCNKPPGLQLGLVRDIARILRDHHATCVITHHIGPLIYGGLAARLARVPRIVHVEHDIWQYDSAKRRHIAGLFMALVRPELVAISPQLVARLRQIFPRRNVTLIQNGVDLACFDTKARDSTRSVLAMRGPIIGSAGRLETVKGHDILLEAFARLAGEPNLVLVGDGSQRKALETQAKTLGIDNRVTFLGHSDALPRLYPAFDVFCLPSRNEGLPLAILEAQACGVPVVATAVGGVAAALCPDTGLCVPPDNPEALAAALTLRLGNPAKINPRGFVAAHFDWAKTLQNYSHMIGA